ncbi:uncharacterized protein BJ212DRAFT_209652 [Suillus subaureus]|uniref:DUF6533 domain-containing protein n=1 Tax=Suillus subaureus TaxID=48587 RepID=A0A9P7EB25_9AGAM|nr:uncharacterized protein BJ212DRAFT_209652 [Suillus subaureus]KAG1816071.1 hypothetical protein BJ212DRAFT_209652 [Suillus subaureus]
MTSPLEIALRLQTVKYFKMVGLAVLVFDYCIKLEAEINLTWGRKWNSIRIIFAVARYMPFVNVPVDLIYSLGPTSPQLCLSLYQVSSWLNIIGTIAAESLLFVRTYTLWGRSRVLLVALLLLALGCIAGCGVVGASALSLFKYEDPPLGTSGCYQTQRIAIYAVNYALLALFETVILSLNVFQAWHHRRRQGSRLIAHLYWDGIIYVLYILAMTMANIVVIGLLPSEYSESINTRCFIAFYPLVFFSTCEPLFNDDTSKPSSQLCRRTLSSDAIFI